jgi:hypothetical protein
VTRRASREATGSIMDPAWATIPWAGGLLGSGFRLEGAVAPPAPVPPAHLHQVLERAARGGTGPTSLASRSNTPAQPFGSAPARGHHSGTAGGGSVALPAPSAPEPRTAPPLGGAAASSALSFAGLTALFGASLLLLGAGTRRLRFAPALPRPAPFISLLERPG